MIDMNLHLFFLSSKAINILINFLDFYKFILKFLLISLKKKALNLMVFLGFSLLVVAIISLLMLRFYFRDKTNKKRKRNH